MEDDGFFKDVEEMFYRVKRRGTQLSDDDVWEMSKELVRDEYHMLRAIEKAKREGRDVGDALFEDMGKRMDAEEEKEIN